MDGSGGRSINSLILEVNATEEEDKESEEQQQVMSGANDERLRDLINS